MNMLNINIYRWDKVSRILLGGILVGSVFVLAESSLAWLALLGSYLIFTALVRWDPVYAIVSMLFQLAFAKDTVSHRMPKQAFSS